MTAERPAADHAGTLTMSVMLNAWSSPQPSVHPLQVFLDQSAPAGAYPLSCPIPIAQF